MPRWLAPLGLALLALALFFVFRERRELVKAPQPAPSAADASFEQVSRAVRSAFAEAGVAEDAAISAAVPAAAPSDASVARGMVNIPAGAFMMGSETDPDERPVHTVHVKAFEMDLTEVTTAEYEACVRAGACETTWKTNTCNEGRLERANDPINCVSWAFADAYCRWVRKRLPSEEEWEYAARGPSQSRFPWGAEDPAGRVCFRRWKERLGTCAVDRQPEDRGPFGVLNMAANVAEWTSSRFSENYDEPRRSKLRVTRGGGWGDVDPDYVSTTLRGRVEPEYRSDQIGFRCVRSTPASR